MIDDFELKIYSDDIKRVLAQRLSVDKDCITFDEKFENVFARVKFKRISQERAILVNLVSLVQGSCNIRTLVPQLSGQWFFNYPDRIPVSSGQDDICFYITRLPPCCHLRRQPAYAL